MSEIARRIDQASAHVEPAWSPEREARVRVNVGRGLRRRQRQRTALVVALGTGTLLLGFFLGRQPGPTARQGVTEQGSPRIGQQSLVHLPDGSSVDAVSSDARVETLAVGPAGVTLRLDSGAARFSVTPNPKRPFRVIARDATVTVLGTVFTVALDPKAVRVDVERGRVKVEGVEGTRVLAVGESARFTTHSPDPATAEPSPAPAPAAELAPTAAAPAVPAVEQPAGTRTTPIVTPPSWRALAKDQNYAGALARLTAEGPNAVRDTPEDLLLEADVARLGGRPDRAVAPLQRVIADHPFDPRAPLAAFTLGRTLLEQLGRPREAARAFATARRLDRGGTLTQDALAREVESWAGAGEAEQAHERALEYTRLYPSGRRLAAVRRLGGLDQ